MEHRPLIIAYDDTEDIACLVVAIKVEEDKAVILNTFLNDEAKQLWEKLTKVEKQNIADIKIDMPNLINIPAREKMPSVWFLNESICPMGKVIKENKNEDY